MFSPCLAVDWNSGDTITLVGVLIGSIVGPYMAVRAAAWMERRQDFLRSVRELFRDVTRHANSFHQATFEHYVVSLNMKGESPESEVMSHGFDDTAASVLEHIQSLHADMVMLRLVLGPTACKPIQLAIHELLGANRTVKDNLPPFEQGEAILREAVMKVDASIAAVWTPIENQAPRLL